MAVPLIIARASADAQGGRRIFHAALHGLGGKRLRSRQARPVFEVFDGAIDRCVASRTGMWRVYEIYNIPTRRSSTSWWSWWETAEREGTRSGSSRVPKGCPTSRRSSSGTRTSSSGSTIPATTRRVRRSTFGAPIRSAGDRVLLLPVERPAHPRPQDGDGRRPDEIEKLRAEFRASEREGKSPPRPEGPDGRSPPHLRHPPNS